MMWQPYSKEIELEEKEYLIIFKEKNQPYYDLATFTNDLSRITNGWTDEYKKKIRGKKGFYIYYDDDYIIVDNVRYYLEIPDIPKDEYGKDV